MPAEPFRLPKSPQGVARGRPSLEEPIPDLRALAPPRLRRAGASMARAASALGSAAAGFLYPPACIGCRAEVMTPHGLCSDCWSETRFIASPLCRRCGSPGAGAEDAPFCDACVGRPQSFAEARAALVYEGAGRRMTLRLKHGDRPDLARPAGIWMARAGAEMLADADLIAPAPLHWTRLLRRRFNQAAELARWTARAAGREEALDQGLLRRVRATPSQKGMDRAARIANLAGAFRAAPGREAALHGATVVVVDDVLTTGATLSACAEALRAAGAAQVHALTLARAPAKEETEAAAGRMAMPAPDPAAARPAEGG